MNTEPLWTLAYRTSRAANHLKRVVDWNGTFREAEVLVAEARKNKPDWQVLAVEADERVQDVIHDDARKPLKLKNTGRLSQLGLTYAPVEFDHDVRPYTEQSVLADKVEAIKTNALPVTTAGPTGRELPGEHWADRLVREVRKAQAQGRDAFWQSQYEAKSARLALLGIYGGKRDLKSRRSADREVSAIFDNRLPADPEGE